MRTYAWLLIPALLSLLAMSAAPAQQDAENHPTWAFPVADANPPAGAEPPSGPIMLPDSTKSYTMKEIDDFNSPPDWYPDMSKSAPAIVKSGASDKGYGCAACHLFSGHGHPESADLAGMSADFLEQQMADFKSGDRTDPARMNTIGQATSDDDAKAASEWFAALSTPPALEVKEADMVPKTWVNGGRIRLAVPGGAMEPIGNRIIEVPTDTKVALARSPKSSFIAYVPMGSLAKGKDLATTGGGKTISCTICHGDGLKGFGNIPKLAGQHPTYIARQLFNFQVGTNNSAAAMQMQSVAMGLSPEDILNIAAYASSLAP